MKGDPKHVYCIKEEKVIQKTSKQLIKICEYCENFKKCFPEYFYSDTFGNILKCTPIQYE